MGEREGRMEIRGGEKGGRKRGRREGERNKGVEGERKLEGRRESKEEMRLEE